VLGCLSMIDDSLIMAKLADEVIRRPSTRELASLRYAARLVGRGDREFDVELSPSRCEPPDVDRLTGVPAPPALIGRAGVARGPGGVGP
jgi:hypothetical protein